jgi:hypothetical protein
MEALVLVSAHMANQGLVEILEPHIQSCTKWLLRRPTLSALPVRAVFGLLEPLRAMGQQLLLGHCPQLEAKEGRQVTGLIVLTILLALLARLPHMDQAVVVIIF